MMSIVFPPELHVTVVYPQVDMEPPSDSPLICHQHLHAGHMGGSRVYGECQLD